MCNGAAPLPTLHMVSSHFHQGPSWRLAYYVAHHHLVFILASEWKHGRDVTTYMHISPHDTSAAKCSLETCFGWASAVRVTSLSQQIPPTLPAPGLVIPSGRAFRGVLAGSVGSCFTFFCGRAPRHSTGRERRSLRLVL